MPRDVNDTLRGPNGEARLRTETDRACVRSAERAERETNGLANPSGDRSKPSRIGAKPASDDDGKTAGPKTNGSNDDAGLADGFVAEHGQCLRYVAVWGKWYHYDGTRWREEQTQLVRDLAKRFCQDRGQGRGKTIAAVQALASADRKIAARVDQWDADPWLINTPGGVVDLRTGEMRAHDPGDHMTRIAAVAPGGHCPLWLGFLDRILGSDADLIAYVQRLLGYALTGSQREHAMFFAYGPGGNGKSVLIDTVAGILGDYHATAPIETFTSSGGDRHPTELARLVGARLVTAAETEEGRRWHEARIKTLTGGDRVAARFMRQDFFEFRPQFKLLIAGNHQPVLRTVDEAMRRRFNLLPFSVVIPDAEKDRDLGKKLQAEWPGILQWMLDGCLSWQRDGLKPPSAVTEATAAYLEVQDAMAAWLAELCEQGQGYRESSGRLFASWKSYAERNGEPAMSAKAFSPKLEARGFRPFRTKAERGFIGLRLKQEATSPHWTDK
jgi:putative DNA primase/helicase